jgi:hypothetical protein
MLMTVGCQALKGSLFPASPAQPSTQNVFGITIYTTNGGIQGLPQAAQAGTAWTRTDGVWSNIEPVPRERLWDSTFDHKIEDASFAGIQSIVILGGTPTWALKPGFACGAVDERNFSALGQFAYDLVKRYSVPPYNVHYWELWNEPDAAGLLGCWGDPNDTQYYGGYYYGQMLQVVYPQMKAADPQAQVLVGGLLLDCDPVNPPAGKNCISSRFINGILESGKASGSGPYFDGVAFHAYDYYGGNGTYSNSNWHSSSSTTGPVSIVKSNFLRGVLAQYGYGDRYLVETETALFWGPNVMDPPCAANEPVDMETTKVNYLVQSYAAAVAEGWKANIWYSVNGVRCSGLLKSDLSPTPAYYAYTFAEQKLENAVFAREITDFDGVMGYEYTTPGKRLWVVWSLDGQAVTINLPTQPSVVNRVGEDGKASGEASERALTVDRFPIFIEFNR